MNQHRLSLEISHQVYIMYHSFLILYIHGWAAGHRSEPAIQCEGGQETEEAVGGGGGGGGGGEEEKEELHLLNQSALLSKQQLSETQHKSVQQLLSITYQYIYNPRHCTVYM